MGLQTHIASLLTTAHNRAGTPAWGHLGHKERGILVPSQHTLCLRVTVPSLAI